MNADQLRKLLTQKKASISLRISPELLRLVDEAIKKDPDYRSRNELIEVLILKYLEGKGKL